MTEGPYKLPEGWRWVQLGEVAKVRYGKAKPRGQNGSVPVIGSGGAYDTTEEPLVTFPTVVIGRKGSAGEAILVREQCWPSDTTFYLDWISDVEPSWLWLWLILYKPSPFGTTATLPSVRREDLERHLIPLPPLDEQRRIVARVEELMARVREAKRLRQQAKEDAERLIQAALAEVFPRPGTEPPTGWRWVRLGEVARRESVIVKLSDQPNSTFRYLGMEHVAPGQWEEPCPVEVRGSDIRSQVIAFRPGLVLYGKLRPYLNKVVVPSNEGVASTEFVPIAVRQDMVSPHYLGAFLRCPGFVAYAGRNIAGSRQPRTRLDALWNALIPLPPLDEQRRIVAHLEAVQEKVRALKEAQAATDAELQRLEQAILDRAFRGEL